MPVHDWTAVGPGIFHALHLHWIAAIDGALNDGLLPPDYYSLPEQVAGVGDPDVLTLQLSTPATPPGGNGSGDRGGGLAVAVAPPKVQFRDEADDAPPARKTRSVVIRHLSGHRIVAMIEVVSPSNKGSADDIHGLVDKAVRFLRGGVHLLVLDLLPPGPRDPDGLHPLIWSEFKSTAFRLPEGKPLTLAAYSAGRPKRAFVEPVGVGDVLPDMPLFLTPEYYINLPLEATYAAAWRRLAKPWRAVLEPPAG